MEICMNIDVDYTIPSQAIQINPTCKQKRFFEIAKHLSRKSTYKYRVGAVIVKNGKPIGFGFNKPQKTHPKSHNAYKTIHAELDALIGLSIEELAGADIYIYRELKSEELASARPCDHCYILLQEYGIRKIYFTTTKGFHCESIR